MTTGLVVPPGRLVHEARVVLCWTMKPEPVHDNVIWLPLWVMTSGGVGGGAVAGDHFLDVGVDGGFG